MAEPFLASYLKIERAKKHVQELEAVIQTYLTSNPVSVVTEVTERSVSFKMNFKGVPVETSAIVGDIFHNLRSALDLMAAELCGTPGIPDANSRFPFCSKEGELDRTIKSRKFDKAGEAAVKLVKELMPYNGGNVALRALHDLNIRDKHKMLIVHPISFASPIIDTMPPEGGIAIVGDPSKPSEVKLLFPADCALAGQDLLPTLHELVQVTAGVVESFKALRAPAG